MRPRPAASLPSLEEAGAIHRSLPHGRVELRVRHKLAPILFENDGPEDALAKRATPVGTA
ncbi:MAG: hypothetical protein OXI87_11335 [Albidovulum sp.]|nr:hypothetical protein [Albidovulum sp.]